MKNLISALLLVIGAVLLGVGVTQYLAIGSRESSWNANQARFDETNWGIAHESGRESRWKETPAKTFDRTFPMLLIGVGSISCLLGIFALALPSIPAVEPAKVATIQNASPPPNDILREARRARQRIVLLVLLLMIFAAMLLSMLNRIMQGG